MGGALVGYGARNGDEFALFDLSFEGDPLLDGRERTWVVSSAATAAASCGGNHRFLSSGD